MSNSSMKDSIKAVNQIKELVENDTTHKGKVVYLRKDGVIIHFERSLIKQKTSLELLEIIRKSYDQKTIEIKKGKEKKGLITIGLDELN